MKTNPPKLEIITSFLILMRLAYDVGQAKKADNPAKVLEAEQKLKEYEDLCKQADKMSLHIPKSAI